MCIVIHFLFHRKVDHSKHREKIVEDVYLKVINRISIREANRADKP